MTEVRLWQVVCAGAVGGVLSLIYAFAVGNDVTLPWYTAAAAFTVLGAAAAVIGVYLLTASDVRAMPRCIAFALMCGLAWKPVIDAGSALVTRTAERQSNRDVAARTEEVLAITTRLPAATSLPGLLGEAGQKAAELIRLLPRASDPDVRANADDAVRTLVRAVERVMPNRPHESVSVLTRLAVTGLDTRQAQFAPMALDALRNAGVAVQDAAVASAAFRGLEQIAAAAETRPEAALAAEARYLGAELVVDAAARAEAAGRAETMAQLPTAEALRSLESAQRLFEARGEQARAGRAKARVAELERLTKRPPGPP